MKNELTHNNGLRLVPPRIVPALDDGFRPAVLCNRDFRKAARQAPVPVRIVLERADGGVSRFDTFVADASLAEAAGNFVVTERLLKFLLWSRGGWKIHFSGPDELGRRLQAHYGETTTGGFDAAIMGGKIYERPFEVALVSPDEVPAACESTAPLGNRGNALSLPAPVKTDLKLASPSAFSVSCTALLFGSVNRFVRWTKAKRP